VTEVESVSEKKTIEKPSSPRAKEREEVKVYISQRYLPVVFGQDISSTRQG